MPVRLEVKDSLMGLDTSTENQSFSSTKNKNLLRWIIIICILVISAGLIVMGIVNHILTKSDPTPQNDENNTITDSEEIKGERYCIGRLHNESTQLVGMSCNVTADCFKQTDVRKEWTCTNILKRKKLLFTDGTYRSITCCDKVCICNMENYCNDGSAICVERSNGGYFTCHDCPLGRRGERCQDQLEQVKVMCECFKTFPPDVMESCAQLTYPAQKNCVIKRTGKEYGICMCNTSNPLDDDKGLPDCVP